MMTKEGSTKIVTFMTPGAGVLVLARGNISHIVKLHYFFKYSQAVIEGPKENKTSVNKFKILVLGKKIQNIYVCLSKHW